MSRRLVAALAAFYVPLALAALVWIAWRGGEAALVGRLWGEAPLRDLALGAAVGAACAYLSRPLSRAWAAGRRFEEGLVELVGPMPPSACAVAALLSGTAEELVFRAALQPEIGLIAASILFGLAHWPFRRELWPWPLLAGVVGLLFGALFRWTGGCVLAPLAAHVAVNWLNLSYLARLARQRPPSP